MMQKHRILIVEDDPELRETMKLLLEDAYEVSAAVDGLVGLKNALRNPPDLILLDLKMPNMSGFETCKFLRADKEFDHTAIIVVSGFVSDQDRRRILESGADDFVGKPFDTQDLLHRIEKKIKEKSSSMTPEQFQRRGIFKYRNIVVDTTSLKTFVDGEEIHFSQVEFGILKLLVEKAEEIVARDVFIASLWPGQEVSNRIIDAHLVSIRNKLKGRQLQISSVYGKGYILKSSIDGT